MGNLFRYTLLAGALQPLLPERSAEARRAVALTWLSSVIELASQQPSTLATTTEPLDLAGLWRSACASSAPAGEPPLVRYMEIADHLALWFEAAGYDDLDIHARDRFVLAWISELLDQIRAEPVAFATGARQLVAGEVLRAVVAEWATNTRLRQHGGC